jgi:RimJ/RimL family protein N-acetyltransferase
MGRHRVVPFGQDEPEIAVVIEIEGREDGSQRLVGALGCVGDICESLEHPGTQGSFSRYPDPVPRGLLETDRLLIQRFARRDAATLDEAIRASLPDLNQWLPWARMDYNSADTAAFLRESIQAWREDRAWDYSIRWKAQPHHHVGNVSFWTVSKLGKIVEVGYWVRSDETSQGVCTEAVDRILREAFDALGYHKAVLRIAVGNTPSDRVAQKLGFTREGVLREELLIRGNWVDHSLWSLLDREYRAIKRSELTR